MRHSPEMEQYNSSLTVLDGLLDVDPTNEIQVIKAGTTLERTVKNAIFQGFGLDLANNYTDAQVALLRNLHSGYEIAVDSKFMHNVHTGVAQNPAQYPFQQIYDRLSAMEAQAVGLTEDDRVMHIGTGWPGTAIGFYQQFGTPVTCVEIDPAVARQSQQALQRLGFSENQLRVVCADGTKINPEGHKVVLVSAMVPHEDKTKILQNMRDLAIGLSDPLFMLRTPLDRAREFFYQPLPSELRNNNGIQLLNDTGPSLKPNDPLQSFIYRVKPMPAIGRGEDRLLLAARRNLRLAA